MSGLGKRPAEFVPGPHRQYLDLLSKADLMEVAYSFALRLSEDNAEDARNLVIEEHRTVSANLGRKPRRI